MRWSTFVTVLIAGFIGFALFHVKYRVIALEYEWQDLQRKILANQEAVHILRAEWSYLTEPSRLQQLVEKFLDLKPVVAEQIVSLETILNLNLAEGQNFENKQVPVQTQAVHHRDVNSPAHLPRQPAFEIFYRRKSHAL